LKKLYEGSQVTRGPDNRYRSVRDLRIPVDEARKAVMRRTAESLGVFSAEAIANFARFEFNMAETRKLLRELEREGRLVKGFFARGERTVYWMLKEGLDEIEKLKFDRTFVLSPLDNLALFLRSEVGQRWRMGGHVFVIFQGTEMVRGGRRGPEGPRPVRRGERARGRRARGPDQRRRGHGVVHEDVWPRCLEVSAGLG